MLKVRRIYADVKDDHGDNTGGRCWPSANIGAWVKKAKRDAARDSIHEGSFIRCAGKT